MAAVIRVRIGHYTKKYIQSLLLQPSNFKVKQKVCIHSSSLLYVAGQEIKMPSLSPTMSEGTIVKWLKKEGDLVTPGEVLCDIETDKAVISLETEEEGILARILVPEMTKNVPVGKVIALLVGEGEDWKSAEIPNGSSSPGPPPAPAGGSPVSSQAQSGTVEGQEVRMPSLSPTMTAGTIVKWLKKEGDKVSPGEALCDIQTDKAVISLETEEEGILAKILVSEDSKDVPVGQLIALLVAEGENWRDVKVGLPEPSVAPQASTPIPKAPVPGVPATQAPAEGLWPAVRALLGLYQLQASQVAGTGHKGRLLKGDVLKHIAANNLKPKPPKSVPLPSKGAAVTKPRKPAAPQRPSAGFTDIPITNMRKVIAKRLSESKSLIPHSYGSAQCSLDELLALRSKLKASKVKVSINDFIVKAVACALHHCPKMNAQYVHEEIRQMKDVDVCVAVATDAGLITPIVNDALGKGIVEISDAVRDLATRARAGKLLPHEFQGGSFTISNLGMFGVKEFSAIINPPQVGILAIGGGQVSFGADGKTTTNMIVTLSYDNRVIDNAEAAKFLETVKQMLEEPSMMLVGWVRNQELQEAAI